MKKIKIVVVIAVIAALAVGIYIWKTSKNDICCPHDAGKAAHQHGPEDEHGHEHDEADTHDHEKNVHEQGGHEDHGHADEHGHDHGSEEGVVRVSEEFQRLGGIETAVVSTSLLDRIITVNGRVTQDAETEDMTQVAAIFDVYESNFTDVRVGQSINVFALTDPEHKHSGEIAFVSSRVDPLANTLKVRAVINNADLDWKLGMFLKGEILIDQKGAAIAISSQAVQTLEGKPVVFVRTADDEFAARAIVIASQSGGMVYVSEGLKEGEEIVIKGSFILKSETMKDEMEHSHDH